MNKLIVILGPTASGKTGLSIKLAKKFNGEIISADSRQVYKGLDIGTGKIEKDRPNNKQIKTNNKRIFVKDLVLFGKNSSAYIAEEIPHHLLDIASPKRRFTVAQFQKIAFKKIKEIQGRSKLPFLVGGTGFYIKSIVDEILLPEVKPNWKLRKKLERKNTDELFLMLKKLDAKRAETIDSKNPRRLIRAIEIVRANKKTILTTLWTNSHKLAHSFKFDSLQIGIKKSPDELKNLIKKRLEKRLRQGMTYEVKNLNREGLSWKRLEELGLEYRYVAQYLQGKLTYKQMVEILEKEIWHFVKRQMTWFKKDKRIYWVKSQKEAENLIVKFLNSRELAYGEEIIS